MSDSNSKYTVGWICALPTDVSANDNNHYSLGRMGKHNVVIAVMPQGEYGTASAAVARDMLHSFPNVRIGLMVGIGGGAPSSRNDIRLGDVVVSSPANGRGGVFQYDFGKTVQGHAFHTTGFLNQPPTILRTAMAGLNVRYQSDGHELAEAIDGILDQKPRLKKTHKQPNISTDRLYVSSKVHGNPDASCVDECGDDAEDVKEREERGEDDDNPVIHYGLIASANQVMKDAVTRDRLIAESNVLCFEMEAAGLMNHFPCLVIRGICDYSDSHKNKAWQGYAAMTAAAYTKDLLAEIAPNKVEAERTISETLANVRNDVSEIKRDVKTLGSRWDKRQDLSVLDWIAPNDFGRMQSDCIQRREPGTDQWLLNSEEFGAWLAGGPGNSTLFCWGMPGAGKTVLASVVIDHLLNHRFRHDSTVGVAFAYCVRRESQKVEDVLGSLLKHLSQGLPSPPESVKALYEEHQRAQTRPSLGEISKCLRSVVGEYKRTFLVVDAIDECPTSGGCRAKFLKELFALRDACGASLFATSRRIPEIERQFKDGMVLEVKAADADVARYVNANMSRLPAIVSNQPGLQEHIKEVILEVVCGMFLLAQLYFEALAGLCTLDEDKSKTYSDLYQDIMKRIMSSSTAQSKLAKNALSWIVCAERPLSTCELRHALAVGPKDTALNPAKMPETESIVSACAGLVTVDKSSDIVRLVHPTAQEYFSQRLDTWFPDARAYMATACVGYLSFGAFASGFCKTDAEFEARLRSHPFYRHAAQNWGYHACEDNALGDEVGLFLQDEARTEAAGQALLASSGYFPRPDYSQDVPSRMTGLHLAACFGAGNLVQDLLSRLPSSADLRDSHDRTPLSWAIAFGREDVAELLLRSGKVDPECRDHSNGRTPLSLAAENGLVSVVELLLKDRRVDPSSRDEAGRTPLYWAASNGHKEVVRSILSCPRLEGEGCHAALLSAIGHGEEEMVQTVLDVVKATTPRWKADGAPKALCWAAENGSCPIFTLLLTSSGADVNCRDDKGTTPLMKAVIHGHRELAASMLTSAGADPSLADNDGRTALSLAAEHGQDALFDILLASGGKEVEVDSRDNFGRTPLSKASEYGHQAIARRLLNSGRVEVDARDKYDQTPLFWAAKNGHDAVVELLLATGKVDVNSRSVLGRTPLSEADKNYHAATVELLRRFDATTITALAIGGLLVDVEDLDSGSEGTVDWD